MASMMFYMTPGSCSTGIHILLEELDEVFEVTIVNLPKGDHFKPDYVALNPKSTIPTLVRRDGTVLTEVLAIAVWLARSHPRAGLWPAGPEAEARALEIMSHVTATIHGQGFARIFATASFCTDPAGHPAVQAKGREIVERGFAWIEGLLPEDGYALGTFSAVDPILFYVAFWARKTDVPLPPRIAAHFRRMLARPAVVRVLKEEGYNPASLA